MNGWAAQIEDRQLGLKDCKPPRSAATAGKRLDADNENRAVSWFLRANQRLLKCKRRPQRHDCRSGRGTARKPAGIVLRQTPQRGLQDKFHAPGRLSRGGALPKRRLAVSGDGGGPVPERFNRGARRAAWP
ncbi:MAG TPA: hypothetical protein DEP05_03295 [Betaproteobacteria bacterium]|nr:hypothetical protein [Betaproteobacteria bacterium]